MMLVLIFINFIVFITTWYNAWYCRHCW